MQKHKNMFLTKKENQRTKKGNLSKIQRRKAANKHGKVLEHLCVSVRKSIENWKTKSVKITCQNRFSKLNKIQTAGLKIKTA